MDKKVVHPLSVAYFLLWPVKAPRCNNHFPCGHDHESPVSIQSLQFVLLFQASQTPVFIQRTPTYPGIAAWEITKSRVVLFLADHTSSVSILVPLHFCADSFI
jgi:hypothetical protein